MNVFPIWRLFFDKKNFDKSWFLLFILYFYIARFFLIISSYISLLTSKKNWKFKQNAWLVPFQTSNVGLPSVSPSKKSAVSITTAAPVPSSNDSSSSSTSNSNEHILRTKQVLERLFPNVPSTSVDYDEWLTNLASHIEETQQKKQQNCVQTQKPATASSNNHQNGGDDEDVDDDEGEAPGVDNITGNGTHHQGNGTKSTANTEELILQNAQLKSTVDEYKSIVAETVSVRFEWTTSHVVYN